MPKTSDSFWRLINWWFHVCHPPKMEFWVLRWRERGRERKNHRIFFDDLFDNSGNFIYLATTNTLFFYISFSSCCRSFDEQRSFASIVHVERVYVWLANMAISNFYVFLSLFSTTKWEKRFLMKNIYIYLLDFVLVTQIHGGFNGCCFCWVLTPSTVLISSVTHFYEFFLFWLFLLVFTVPTAVFR